MRIKSDHITVYLRKPVNGFQIVRNFCLCLRKLFFGVKEKIQYIVKLLPDHIIIFVHIPQHGVNFSLIQHNFTAGIEKTRSFDPCLYCFQIDRFNLCDHCAASLISTQKLRFGLINLSCF